MKKILLSAVAIALIATTSPFITSAWAQSQASETSASPHRVGLVDMAHVFKEYEKFKVLREDLKAEIEENDQKAQAMAQQIQALQEQMKQLNEGSPEYLNREKQLIKVSSEFEAFRKGVQRDFLRKESQVYKTVYLEVLDAVEKCAEHYKYTLVIRFNREGLESASQPPEVIQRMNQQVVYYRKTDDMTDAVLQYLHYQYKNGGRRSASGNNSNTPPADRPAQQ